MKNNTTVNGAHKTLELDHNTYLMYDADPTTACNNLEEALGQIPEFQAASKCPRPYQHIILKFVYMSEYLKLTHYFVTTHASKFQLVAPNLPNRRQKLR